MKQCQFKLVLVNSILERLHVGMLYVTRDMDVAGHLFACGCGSEVITPLSPTDWSLTVDRRVATLEPSIGNWDFPCRSHYFILGGKVVWAENMSTKAIAQGRQRNKARKQTFYRAFNASPPLAQESVNKVQLTKWQSVTKRLVAWWKSLLGL
jgi:hypothetical protein